MLSTILSVFLAIVSITCAFLMIGVILIQQNKAGGGLGAVSGGMTESMFGAAATNVLTKATTWIAAIFLLSTLLLASVTGRLGRSNVSAAEKVAPPAAAATSAAPAADDGAVEAEAASDAGEAATESTGAVPAADAPAPAAETPAAEQK